MNFKQWLTEGRFRGPVGGAFGKDPSRMNQGNTTIKPKQHGYNPEPVQRMDNRFQGMNTRVQYGKGIEKQIFDNLIACGLKLREPSDKEDMYDKVDGWWDNGQGEQPIQIKYRDTGNDILFEVMKDYHRGIPGRDMIGKAVYYAVLTKVGGQINMVAVAEAKQLIQQAVAEIEQKGLDQRGNFQGKNGITLRVRPDPQSGQEKLMAYIPLSALKSVRSPCSANIKY